MELRFSFGIVPKQGHAARDCEDSVGVSVIRGRFAVADGATEAFDSRRWARLLTRAWINVASSNIQIEELPETINRLGRILEAKWKSRQLPWYVQERTSEPSFAAFAGLQLNLDRDASQYGWHFAAIGDACLILERDGQFASSSPVATAEEFSFRPVLLPSRMPGDWGHISEHICCRRGLAVDGDVLILATDALAQWYLRHAAADAERREQLRQRLSASNDGNFATFIEDERASGRIRNDDVAVVYIEVLAP